MNLTEVLNSALPEIPALKRDFRPKVQPTLIHREHIEGGRRMVNCLVPEKGFIYRWTPEQFGMVTLFDGTRTVEEVSEVYFQQYGERVPPDALREIVAMLDEQGFWYKTPLEANIALKERLAEERQKRAKRKSKYGDVADLRLWYWNPDNYLSWIYPRLKFIYSRWFSIVSLAAFAFMVYIFVDRWSEIGQDTLHFYNLREKTFPDIVVFYLLVTFVLFIHESAHGLTCKHYGGHVYKMGFNLIYLTPAFYTEAQQIFVYGGKWERLSTVFWGVWSELLLCAIVTPIWWGTPAGSWAHNLSYMLMLITGVGVVFFNWNPLIKLDGYYLLTEGFALANLKEDSTAYLSNWLKKHIWRLPVEVPFVPKRRRPGYVIYAVASGMYSYTLLLLASRLVGNVASVFSPDWGFLVGIAIGLRIFRSRILKLVQFMKTLYLDKKERVRNWFRGPRLAITAFAAVLILFAPIWRDTVDGHFVLEPAARAVVRAAVPGTVYAVYTDEGQHVAAGATLARLRNLKLEAQAAKAFADFRLASARATAAQMRYADFGAADQERQRLAAKSRSLSEQVSELSVVSPISGTVLTPRFRDRLDSSVTAGTELVEVGDLSRMRSRIYLAEFEVRKAKVGAPVRLLPDSSRHVIQGTVASIAPASAQIESGLVEESKYKGIRPPNFYVAELQVENPGEELKSGVSGMAKIFIERRSLAGMIWEPVLDFLRRKIW